MKTYYGTKMGMTQVWTKSGLRLPVTIIKAEPIVVTQLKTVEKDGYEATQIGVGSRRRKTVSKALATHLSKSGVIPRTVREVRESSDTPLTVGDTVKVSDVLTVGDVVKVSSTSKGRGFTGVMQRWGFKGGPRTHGQSDRARAPGSIGQGTSPGRVHKGKKMAGRMGNETFTIRNLQIIKIDEAANELWLNGPIPGSRNDIVQIVVAKAGTFEGLREEAKKEVVETEVEEVIEEVAKEVKAEVAETKE